MTLFVAYSAAVFVAAAVVAFVVLRFSGRFERLRRRRAELISDYRPPAWVHEVEAFLDDH